MRQLKDFIAVYDDVLERELCERMIAGFHASAKYHMRNGAGVREGLEDSSWTELNVTALADPGFKRLFESVVLDYFRRYNAQIGLTLPISPLKKLSDLMMKRYRADRGDRFQVHFDATQGVSNRYLVFLWYLNDVARGGETWFPDLDLRIAPKAGRMLVFPPYWMFQHAGLPPTEGDKYIVSTYALY